MVEEGPRVQVLEPVVNSSGDPPQPGLIEQGLIEHAVIRPCLTKPDIEPVTPEAANGASGRQLAWPWRVGLVVESGELAADLSGGLAEMHAVCQFQVSAASPPFEIGGVVERHKPDLIFAELAAVSGPAAEWLRVVRSGSELPVVVAVHRSAEPSQMIAALRAGASEFLSMPVRPALSEAMDRVATQLESRQTATSLPGKLVGVLSAKGGCGGTTLACHLAVALETASTCGKVLMADLDHQSPAAHRIYRVEPQACVSDALNSVRRLNMACWPEFTQPVGQTVDILAGAASGVVPEPWRIENLFRFVKRNYAWILADLGRHLNPSNWSFLASLDELLLVTAPDVLALYQTRSVLQTLANRGFEKSRVRLILNRNQNSPQDFWLESIEQMFDMSVLAVLPFDPATLGRMSRDRFEFPAGSAYGRAVSKIAGRIVKPN